MTENDNVESKKKRPLYQYLYLIVLIWLYGLNMWFRISLGPITDVLAEEYNTTASGIGILSSSYFVVYVALQVPVGLFLEIYESSIALIFSSFGLCILSAIFPFTKSSIIFATIIRALAGFVTAPIWLSGVALIGKLFGNNNISICCGMVMMSGGLHIFIGSIIQAEIYGKFHDWKSIYYYISVASFSCGLAFIICLCRERQYIPNYTFKRVSEAAENIKTNEDGSTCLKLKQSMLETVTKWLNWCVGIVAFCFGMIYYGAAGLWLIPYLMIKYSYSRSRAALISGLLYLTASVSFIVYGESARRIRKRKLFIISSGILYMSFVIFIYVPDLQLWAVITLNLITGIASGVFPITFTLSREYNWYYKTEETTAAFVNMLTQLSAFFGQYVVGALLDYHKTSIEHTVNDYNFAFIVIPIALGIALVLSLLLKETYGENINWLKEVKCSHSIIKYHSESAIKLSDVEQELMVTVDGTNSEHVGNKT